MKFLLAFGMFVLLIGQLTAEESVEVEGLEEAEEESMLHNIVKRSNPGHYGYQKTGKVKIGAPVVVKRPVYKQVATYVQDGFQYAYPGNRGNFRGNNFNRAGGFPSRFYPGSGYQYQGGYPGAYRGYYPYQYATGYQYGNGYPYDGRAGYPYGSGYQRSGYQGSGFQRSAKGYGNQKAGY